MSERVSDIVLIGFRGAGKTCAGRLLAARLGRPFVDTDALIEARSGLSVAEFFMRKGEESFRISERQVVAELLGGQGRVIATGGGVPLDPANREVLRRLGPVILLDVDASTAQKRLEADEKKRPALTGLDFHDEIHRLLGSRRAAYDAAAQLVVDARGDLDEVVATLTDIATRPTT